MDLILDGVDLGFVVNLATLREVLKSFSIHGRRWWIASDPPDALETRTVTIGHGDAGCVDRLNTLYFQIPILNQDEPMAGTDRLVLLFDSSVISAEQAGFYVEKGRVLRDHLADLESFFDPIEQALVARLGL
jgi:hypothetical protein